MGEAFRWIGYLVLALIVFVVSVFAAYRIRGPSHAQRDALALMQKDYKPKQGRNAFPLLWYMQYDVPESELDARMAGEVADVTKRLAAAGNEAVDHEPAAMKLAEAASDPAALCDARKSGCLAKVIADPEAMRAKLATYPVMRAREKAFEESDYYWGDFPLDYRAVLVANPGPAQRIWLSAYALKYADDDHVGALADVCRNVGTWRRLHRGNHSLIGSMTAIAEVDGGVHLFAEMLAALPANERVPDECGIALQPIEAADVDRCSEMAGEFAFGNSTIRLTRAQADVSWWERAQAWVMLDMDQFEAWRAEQDAQSCGDAATARMLTDLPLPAEVSPPISHRAECIASAIGCILSDVASPAYLDYDSRTLDFVAHLRLAATLLWMRESTLEQPLAQRFDERPETLRSGRRKSGGDSASGMLFVDNLYTARDARFELPLAAP